MLHTPLNIDVIRGILTTKVLGHRLELFEQIDSTNREALDLAQADVAHGTVVVAETQTNGRGRLARTWFSPPGINVYCSTVLRKAPSPVRMSEWLSWLPLTAAVAAAEAIESIAGITVGVKWPNDLLIAERKVGGILCESGTSQRLGPFQVVGIGINVNGTRADFPSDLQDMATTIADEVGCMVDRNGLLSQLLYELEVCVDEFFISGCERVSRAYSLRCSTLGRVVRASLADGKELVGVAESIGEDGSLQIAERPPAGSRLCSKICLRVADIVHLRAEEMKS